MRAVLWVGGVVVALAALVGAGRLWAESKEEEPAPRTRIAIYNLTYVIKNYDKYKRFQDEIKEYVRPYQKRDAELKEQLKELRGQAEISSLVPTKGEDRDEKTAKEELEDKAKKIQRKIEENAEMIKKKLGAKSDEQMKIVYIQVVSAAQEYAKSHGLDLVMQYNDATTPEDYLSAQTIARKLNASGLMPAYLKTSMDISGDLVKRLNEDTHKK